MKYKYPISALLILVLSGCALRAAAQVYCPTNINFESGNLSNWNFYTGSNNGSSGFSTLSSTTALANRHVLTTGTTTDYYGGFPVVDPFGGSYSLKLGNDNVNAQVDQARYTLTVPSTVNNYSLIYRYAVVLENPSHSASDQPFFRVRVYNAATGAVINCASFKYVSQSSLPGFQTSSRPGNHASGSVVYFKPWTTASLNLTGQAGNTLIVEFTTADCALGAHMGYSYVDISCGLFAISSSTCNATSPLSAPAGFMKYTWYNASYSAMIDTGRSITVATPASLTQYHVVLTPFPGYGCADTLTTQITGSSLSVTAGRDTMVCNNPGISMTPTVNGNAPPYLYSWTPATGLSCTSCLKPVASPAAHTNYILSVTDSLGCIRRDTVLVKAPVSLAATATDALCFGSATGSASASAALGTGPYSYSWNTVPVQSAAGAAALTAGTYLVTATDAKGCTASRQVSVSSPPALASSISSTDSISCYGGSNGKASATAAGGKPPYAYRWNTSPFQTSASATGLSAAGAVVTVTDSKGCTSTSIATIPQPQPLGMTAQLAAALCRGGSSGTATIQASGGTPPYEYAAGPGAFSSGNVLNGLAAGTHVLHLRDARGCTLDTGINITEPAALGLGFTAVTPACNGGSNGIITLSASGGSPAYQYSYGSGLFTAGTVFSALVAGTHIFHLRDANGCVFDTTLSLGQPAPLAAMVTPASAMCFGSSTGGVQVAASGGTPAYTYAAGSSAFSASSTLTGLAAGVHAIHIKDANGCLLDTSCTISQPVALSIGYTLTQPLCFGASNGTIQMSGSGGILPYQYALNAGSFGSAGSFSGLQAGTFTLHIRDANNCLADSMVSLSQPATLTVSTSKTNVSCNGGSNGTAQAVTSGGTGPYAYSWTGTVRTTASVTGLSAGSYTVTATDSKGCTATSVISISQPTAVTAATSSVAPVCANTSTGSASASGSGGTSPYSYSWNTAPSQSTASAGLLAAGTYTVTVTDALGCSATAIAVVAPTLPMTVSVTPYPVSCFGMGDGKATAAGAGSTAPYSYAWNTTPVQTAATATSLLSGTYTVTATSAAGCTGTTQVTIPQPALLKASALTGATCSGLSQGIANASATGGTSPFSYRWNTQPAQLSAAATGLFKGNYMVTVTDSKGCVDSAIAIVATYPVPKIDAGPDQEICAGRSTTLQAGGASSYSWSPASSLSCSACSSPIATPGSNTLYLVTGTDEHSCQAIDSVRVTVVQRVPVSVDPAITICEGDSARLGASGGISRRWLINSDGATADTSKPMVRPRTSATYQVIITENQCFTDTLEQDVEVLPTPTVDLGPDLEAPIGTTIRLDARVTGTRSIAWIPSTGLSCASCFTPEFLVRGKVTYIAEVKNILGCPAYDTVSIKDICDAGYFYFANVFTPNGDGQNDRFYPQSAGITLISRFMIYDRWGEILFSASNFYANEPEGGWDGTFKNQAIKPDVYVYVMDAVCEGGNKVIVRGDVSLIR